MAEDFRIGTLDMLTANPGLAIGEGLAYDPPYLYVTPHNEYIVAKIDTRSFAVVATLDLSLADPRFTGMSDSFVVGRYLYILPHFTTSGPFYQTDVVRVDLRNFTPAGVSSLRIVDNPSNLYLPRDGFNDGVHGYVNVRTLNGISVIRFGLGDRFVPGSVSSIRIMSFPGTPIINGGNFLTCDRTHLYGVVMATQTVPLHDLYLVAVPLADFRAEAAVFTRLTRNNYPGASIIIPFQLVDDGTNLWTFPLGFAAGPLAGTWIPPIRIPKANPAAAVVTTPPPGQRPGSQIPGSGQAIYDGWRYAYASSSVDREIVQLDTRNPGTVNFIDISAFTSDPMWGVLGDGYWAYAVSFVGGAGRLLRFRPTLPPPAGHIATMSETGSNIAMIER